LHIRTVLSSLGLDEVQTEPVRQKHLSYYYIPVSQKKGKKDELFKMGRSINPDIGLPEFSHELHAGLQKTTTPP
jgi:hypothetical protein